MERPIDSDGQETWVVFTYHYTTLSNVFHHTPGRALARWGNKRAAGGSLEE